MMWLDKDKPKTVVKDIPTDKSAIEAIIARFKSDEVIEYSVLKDVKHRIQRLNTEDKRECHKRLIATIGYYPDVINQPKKRRVGWL